MSRRDEYPAGVPCFVDTLTADLDAAKTFYRGIFGWEFAGPGPMPGDPPGEYFVARVQGDDVAGVGTMPAQGGGEIPPAWNTHVAVDGADEAAARARAAGGSVLVEPFDAPPAGRMAVITDPAGGVLTVWEAGDRAGAARVNEHSAWAMSLLTTPDPGGATAFYRELFGWEAEAFGPFWVFRLPGYVGGEAQQPVPRDVVAAMTASDQSPPTPAAWSVDFWIADADAAAAAAPGLGGSVVAEPFDDAMFRRAMLAAPDGAAFAVSQPRYDVNQTATSTAPQ
ncbi:MAG TPA: VOC family protein [Solirubrobacteraceae bacterium]|nr:VOC family protein [Solirubrobacteraceae bacterium]